MDIEIRLFGPLEVVTPKGRLGSNDFPSRKAKQVFQVLALAEGRVVSKDRLIDTLWRRRMPRNPAATVELAVSLLRSTLSSVTDQAVVVTAPGGYRLDSAVADVDTARFDQLLQLSAESSPDARLVMLAEAVRLADRPLFEDELGAEWVANDRERFRAKAEAAALDLGRLALAADDTALALSMAERARESSEFVVEEAYALGVAALAQQGRRVQARALLAELETRLEHEEARSLSAESMALRSLIDASSAPPAVGVVRVPAVWADVPWPLPFLGRAKELATARGVVDEVLSAPSAGLLLVDGDVGVGVSRFLQEVAAGCSPPIRVFTMQGRAEDRSHPMLAASHLLRALARASKSRKQVVVDEAVAQMFNRVADLFEGIGPAVLFVDDAELLDDASAAVVRALLAPGALRGLCVVAGARSASAVDQTPMWATSIAGAHISLGLLTADDLATLAVDNALQFTGGHAATLAACVEAARRDGLLSPDEQARVAGRADELGDLGMQALAVLARAGRPTKAADVAHALHIGQSTAAELLRRASKLGLLRGTVRYGQDISGDLLRDVLRARAGARQS